MASFFREWEFPSEEYKIKIFKVLTDFLHNGAKGDNFEGFKILYR